MRPYYVFASISDIHIGNKILSPKSFKKQLKNQYFDKLYNSANLDAIFVLGDVADYILGFGTAYAEVHMWFGRELLKLASHHKATVVVVSGTPSHDNDQFTMWEDYVNNDEDVPFFVCTSFQQLTIMKDFKLLILPDKKVTKIEKSLVKALLSDTYDMILGHGVIDKMEFFEQESENVSTTSYVYPVKELLNCTLGPILFGHIHQFTQYENKFFYISSFTKLERKVGNHGFMMTIMMKDDHTKYLCELEINNESINFHRISFDQDDLNTDSIEKIIEKIENLIKSSGEDDLIQIKLKVNENPIVLQNVMMIENRFRHSNKRVTIVKKRKNVNDEIRELAEKEELEQSSYLFDKNLKISEIFSRYFNEEFKYDNPEFSEIDIDPDIINEVLAFPELDSI